MPQGCHEHPAHAPSQGDVEFPSTPTSQCKARAGWRAKMCPATPDKAALQPSGCGGHTAEFGHRECDFSSSAAVRTAGGHSRGTSQICWAQQGATAEAAG
eukprot:15445981-Alexandrium_andersonii.AAC.2